MSLTNPKGVITEERLSEFYQGILPYLNGGTHAGFTPVGSIIAIMGNEAPTHYLKCDGIVYNIADYLELATYFEDQFEAKNFFGGDGVTTFAVPDLRGEFLRGTGTNSHENQGSGEDVGTHQDATLLSNYWTYNNNIYVSQGASTGTVQNADYRGGTAKRNSIGGTADTTGNSANFTSRPTNTSVLYCIATKNIFVDVTDFGEAVDAEDIAAIIAEEPPVARNNFQDYSTNEQIIGRWIDGKPIYQKTIELSSAITAPQNAWADTGITGASLNIDKLVGQNATAIDDTASSGSYINFPAYVAIVSNNIKLLQTRTEQQKIKIFTLQYTKTTD